MSKVSSVVNIENAKIVLRNFSGEEGPYNKAGVRSFGILLDEEMAETLQAEGWNVKRFKVKEEGDVPQAFLKVMVRYDKIPPKIYIVTNRKKTLLTKDTVGALDYADIKYVDAVITPYNWTVRGESGVSAYVKNMYVTIEEDEFSEKYADLEEED